MAVLVPDVLLHIFRFLRQDDDDNDLDDLINAAQVCKSWNSLIATSVEIMSKLHLVINCKEDVVKASERSKYLPFQNIILNDTDYTFEPKTEELLNEIFTEHQDHIKSLTINTCKIRNLIDLLAIAENIEHLKITDNHDDKASQFQGRFELKFPNLKHLHVFAAAEIVNHIKSHQIEVLVIRQEELCFEDSEEKDFSGYENLNEFLKTCKNLKELKIISETFVMDLRDCPFHLTHFELHPTGDPQDPQDRLTPFLKSQKDTLKVLKLPGYGDRNIFEFAAFELELEELNIGDIHSVTMNGQKFNKTIKKFTIGLDLLDEDSLEYYCKVLMSLQSLETLEIGISEYSRNKCFGVVEIFKLFSSMSKLTDLTLFLNDNGPLLLSELAKVKIEQVTTLTIDKDEFYNRSHNIDIVNCFPNIKILKLKENPISTENLINFVQTLESLEEIHVDNHINRIIFNDTLVEAILSSKIRKITTRSEYSKPDIPDKLKGIVTNLYEDDGWPEESHQSC